jgi:hypothetical protein
MQELTKPLIETRDAKTRLLLVSKLFYMALYPLFGVRYPSIHYPGYPIQN